MSAQTDVKGAERPRLFLIDGHSYIYRAYFAIRNLSTSKGLPTNAIYGFTTMLLKIVRDQQPDYLAVAFDAKGPTLRHAEYREYKAQRAEMPDPLRQQIPYIHRVVEAFRIPALLQEGFEADDLIGTLARQAEEAGLDVTIVSGDKDMFQLITPRTCVYDTMKDKVYRTPDVQERFGVEPDRVVEIMGLMGDSIDNIPGVPGIGEKTAVDLIRRFGSIENLLARLEELEKPKLRENLRAFAEQARMSHHLAQIKRDCPVELNLDRFQRTEPDTDAMTRLFLELEFGSLLKRVESPARPAGPPRRASGPADFGELSRAASKPGRVEITDSDESLREMTRALASAKTIGLGFWTLPNGPARPSLSGRQAAGGSSGANHAPGRDRSAILGISLAASDRVFYIPLGHHYLGAPAAPSSRTLLEQLQPLLSDASIRKVGHDLKAALLTCHQSGLSIEGPTADTMIASYLLNPNRRDHSLETVAMDRLGLRLPELTSPLAPEIPVELMASAAGERVSAVLQLDSSLRPLLHEQGLDRLFDEIEMPLVPVLAEMEEVGIKLDVDQLSALSMELETQLSVMVKRIQALAGTVFNLNSPKQLAEILFDRLGLKPIKKTKTGYSTNEEVLQQLALQHELPAEILNYRQLTKLKSTYIDALPRLVNPETQRLHTSLNQTVAATGRLSSSEPNLQNIPVKGEWGPRIRRAFIAEKGCRLLSADYNQVELRILAHLSEDPNLLSAFQRGEDIHTTTAVQIFELAPNQITSEMRRTAKTVNFGIIYGISPYGLSTTLGVSQSEAKQYIDRYLDLYSGVRRFIEKTIAEAKERGYVTTIFSRRRPIPELASDTPAVRGLGERTAINTPIQGSAADLIKLAMIRIAKRLKTEGRRSRMLLQIHDELIFEVPEKESEAIKGLVRNEMEGVMPLAVPLKVDIGIGTNWNEAHP
ncbi:MAG: DNA polymerase I [Nitrospirae bacterium]|nr:DNA polymerase I [Nitrospirota bacterium]